MTHSAYVLSLGFFGDTNVSSSVKVCSPMVDRKIARHLSGVLALSMELATRKLSKTVHQDSKSSLVALNCCTDPIIDMMLDVVALHGRVNKLLVTLKLFQNFTYLVITVVFILVAKCYVLSVDQE